MLADHYQLVTEWRVEGTVEEVYSVLLDASALPRWWPQVYLKVVELRQGDSRGVGRRVRLHTKGWLPYRLKWVLQVAELDPPNGSRFLAEGDFEGHGAWTFRQDGTWVHVTFDWNVRVHKPILRWFSVLLRPAFVANHRWAMARGQESLRRELSRRRGVA